MTAPESATTTPAPKRGPGRPKRSDGPPAPPKQRPPQKPQKSLKSVGKGTSPEARRLAAAILEVLGGALTTTDAAKALECSLPRYYQLEARAVEGLLAACEPRRAGPGLSLNREVESLRKKCSRFEREVSRQQALVRAAHRAVGLAAIAVPTKPRPGKKRPRRPTTRALVAASVLRAPSSSSSSLIAPSTSASPATPAP